MGKLPPHENFNVCRTEFLPNELSQSHSCCNELLLFHTHTHTSSFIKIIVHVAVLGVPVPVHVSTYWRCVVYNDVFCITVLGVPVSLHVSTYWWCSLVLYKKSGGKITIYSITHSVIVDNQVQSFILLYLLA